MEAVSKFFKEERDFLYRKGEAKKSYEVVSKLILANRFTTAEIAEYASVAEKFVEKVRTDLAKKKN